MYSNMQQTEMNFLQTKKLTMRQPLKRNNSLIKIFCMLMRLRCSEERMKYQLTSYVMDDSMVVVDTFWVGFNVDEPIELVVLGLDDAGSGTSSLTLASAQKLSSDE